MRWMTRTGRVATWVTVVLLALRCGWPATQKGVETGGNGADLPEPGDIEEPEIGGLRWGLFAVTEAVSEPRYDSQWNMIVAYVLEADDIHELWSGFDGTFNLDGKAVQRWAEIPITSSYLTVVVKHDPLGRCVWASIFDGELLHVDLEIDDEDHVVIASALYGSIVMGGETHQTAGHFDPIVARLDPDGAVEWVRVFPGDSMDPDAASTMAISADGRIAIAGRFSHSIGLGDETVTCPATGGESSWFVAVMDAGGEVGGRAMLCPSSGQMSITDVAWSPDGAVGLTGWLEGEIDLGGHVLQSAPTVTPVASGAWTTVLEADGSTRWAHVRQGTSTPKARSSYMGRRIVFGNDGLALVLTSHHHMQSGGEPPVTDSWILTRFMGNGEVETERTLPGSEYGSWDWIVPHDLQVKEGDGEVRIAATVTGTVTIDGVSIEGPERWGHSSTLRSVVIDLDETMTVKESLVIQPRIMPERVLMALDDRLLGVVAHYDECPFPDPCEGWHLSKVDPLLSVFALP